MTEMLIQGFVINASFIVYSCFPHALGFTSFHRRYAMQMFSILLMHFVLLHVVHRHSSCHAMIIAFTILIGLEWCKMKTSMLASTALLVPVPMLMPEIMSQNFATKWAKQTNDCSILWQIRAASRWKSPVSTLLNIGQWGSNLGCPGNAT